jgi:large subunit ribosomal protein L18
MKGSRNQARARRHHRVRKQVRGTPNKPRLVVFRSNRYIYAQVIDDIEGTTLVSASSQEADMRGRALNKDTAAQVGTLVGSRAKDVGVGTVVFDRGGYKYHGRVKALADAAREAGLEF